MLRNVRAVTLACCLAFISSAVAAEPDVAAIEDAVRMQLKDPESALFESIRTTTDESGAMYACGFVNSKNSYGGYVGRTPFLVRQAKGSRSYSAFIAQNSQARQQVLRTCRERGLRIAFW